MGSPNTPAAAGKKHNITKRPRKAVGGHRNARPAQNRSRSNDVEINGLAARQFAGMLIESVLRHRRAFDDALANSATVARYTALAPRDRAFARLIAATVLRHERALTHVLDTFLQKPLKSEDGPLAPVLLVGAAQILMLETPPHAAINIAVEQCRARRATQRFDKLTNAVLRRVSEQGGEIFNELDRVRLAMPDWLWARWVKTYGEERTRDIVTAALAVPPIDLTVKTDVEAWAEKLGGTVLPTGSVRLSGGGRIEELAGYEDGDWWIQDAAAALPVHLLGDVKDLDVLDMCAAPGGKTAALAAGGAVVTALDQSATRVARLKDNLKRLNLTATCVVADAADAVPASGETFDAVLVDAPCTATGTIRRHPDIPHLKRQTDIKKLVAQQAGILENAAGLVKPGGLLVYCTCSLEPEEGEGQISHFLAKHPEFRREKISPETDPVVASDWCTGDGDLRTLPYHLPAEKAELSGMDGFFASRLRRRKDA